MSLSMARGGTWFPATVLLWVLSCFTPAWCAGVCRHDLKVELRPAAHRLIGHDDIRIANWKGGQIVFLLAAKADVKSVLVDGKPWKYTFNSGKLRLNGPSVAKLLLTISISYEAVFNDQVSSAPGIDNPGFGVMGKIGDKGTFLLSDSGWYPSLEGSHQIFRIEVIAPRGISAVTAGALVGNEDRGAVSISRWKTKPIGQGLSLSTGRYTITSVAPAGFARGQVGSRSPRRTGKIPIYTYFYSEDEALSKTYLEASASCIEFYDRLLGAYPFPQWAVVENFFPSGYGFPSYTLLGGTVLRLPFIPETSLRHEIAHSWWGNGVLVDYASGNWCEGLTTYVADYLSRAMTSAEDAMLYREQILRDYATLAASGRDLPLRSFTGRSSPATMAVGYGKAAFVFHMIRGRLGDAAFWNSLRRIYKERLFVRTSWDDFRKVFVRIGGWNPREAREFFNQWIDQKGAPVLKLGKVRLQQEGSQWLVTGTLQQERPWYDFDVTVALMILPNERIDKKIRIKGGSAGFSIQSPAPPKRLVVDPDVNVFRLLSPEEIPATVNSVKGAPSILAVLGDNAPSRFMQAYEILLQGLDHADIQIVSEKEAESKIGGEKNFLFFDMPRSEKLKSLFSSAPPEVQLSSNGFSVNGVSGMDTLFLVFNNVKNRGGITALFLPASEASINHIMMSAIKIIHYGKYSYLTFASGTIRQKGTWEIRHSPLAFDFIGSH
jgi:hypothetical protein